MKILFIPEWYPSADQTDKFSGTFNREHVMAASLYNDVAVLACKRGKGYIPSTTYQKIIDNNVPTWYVNYNHPPVPFTKWISLRYNLNKFLPKIIKSWGKPDIIHTQDRFAYHVMKTSKDMAVPYVVSQHWSGLTFKHLPKYQLAQFRWVFKNANLILPANKFAENDYTKLGLEGNIKWLPNTYDPNLFFDNPGDSNDWLLHVSGFSEEKRVPDIIYAFSQIIEEYPFVQLHFAGSGLGQRSAEDLAKKLLPEGSYIFHGFLPKSELANLMRKCKGFILPSEYETFGCVLMEAMACGLPVLTTRIGGIPALVKENQGLFVEVGDIQDMAKKMKLIILDEHQINTDHVSEEIYNRFSQESIGRSLNDIYQNVINEQYGE